MNYNNITEMIKKEILSVALVILGTIIVTYITFYNEPFTGILRASLSFAWLFILPGWFITGYFEKLTFTARILLGIMLSGALVGIFSYYLGLWILPISKQILLPLALILLGAFAIAARPSTATEYQLPSI